MDFSDHVFTTMFEALNNALAAIVGKYAAVIGIVSPALRIGIVIIFRSWATRLCAARCNIHSANMPIAAVSSHFSILPSPRSTEPRSECSRWVVSPASLPPRLAVLGRRRSWRVL